MRTEKLVAMVGKADKKNGGLINSYAQLFANTKAELRMKLMDMYKDTFWQDYPDDIAVFPIVTESNGYQHCGEEMFRVVSRRFWAKK